MFYSRWNPDDITLPDLLDRASPLLNPASARRNDERLA